MPLRVEGDAPLVLDDARADPRTRENRTIVGIRVVAWAGFPIHGLDGSVIGTFCVVDTVPRRWSPRRSHQRPGDERFVTVALASLQILRGRVLATLSSAGHPPPLLRRLDGSVEEACKPGMALGLFDKAPLFDTKVVLAPGDSLVFYTDGVTEARRGAEELGLDGLRQLVATVTRGSSAAHLVASIEAHLSEYRDGLPRDDTAILVVQVPEPPGGGE